MNQTVEIKFRKYFILSILLVIIVFVLAIFIGKFNISIDAFYSILTGQVTGYEIEYNVITILRIPRTFMALFVGIALSISGLVYQETFQNRLVSPDILGVSSGASVGVALGLLIGLPVMYISFFGFVLGLVSMLATLALAKVFKNKTPTILILSGVIVSGFMTSILSIIKTAANTDTVLPAITYWLLGSFDKVEMSDVFIIAPFIIVGSAILLVIRWQINVIALGEEEAVTKGINYKGYRLVIILVATLITASSVAFAGVIGWIGLVIPHIVRLLIGRNTKYTVPLCMTLGAAFMIIADILSRSIFQAEIPLSAITGFIGVPIFVLILSFAKDEVNNRD